ncbi:pentatricopeptide repeat-containing protein At1g03100, mitochondrial-like isoform X1 [Macadamia integrifolia]|uniref:pentatricopeptide repeat-containing protein At1g03100, mitochondrial-like isoform X1 n=1 Tax=Macadamia integrifolia TaxID=60698 RepID=UPI001C4E4D4E|nr:pentatricopeptide repeat-containing protein At1g03100, mitochondrial-like isoform X1 [Macadamia integrifolia]XP_042482982.1 pentatricopeptide repeat-containing protein At1g03100, mitochondrial-like isoform X1 [Macadamia integrifolia]XP_042482983.1 pentatricopeptide repeat-containing protein At1g03100, mitochondrial-like isoform X1 [Macadamia integrifolia]
MLCVRKLRYLFTPTSSALASLIVQVNSIEVSPCQPWASLSHRSLFLFMDSCPSNSLKIQTFVGNLMNGLIGLSAVSFSTMGERILVQARDPSRICAELVDALDESRFDVAWKLHQQYMQMEGLPRKSVLNKLLTCFAERQDLHWLEKAYSLVELVFEKGKPDLFEKETLIFLAFILARHRLPVPASTVLRKLVEMEEYPPVNAWSAVIANMSQTAPGAYLAAELVLEIGYLFQDNRVDPRKKSNRPLLAMKPNTTVYNIAMAGCLLFGTTRKAEQLLEVMPRVGVKADASLLIIMAHIYERNGRREELKKLKRHLDEGCSLGDVQFQQFYNCLLTCHLNFGDLVSASQIVLEMLRKAKEAQNSLSAATLVLQTAGTAKSFPLAQSSNPATLDGLCDPRSIEQLVPPYEEFSKERNFLLLENEAKETLDVLLEKLHTRIELVTSEGGILRPTERIYAKLVKAYLEADKVKDLAEFLNRAAKEDVPVSTGNSAVIHVINACISLGWLDQAHDLLDEMRLAGVRTGSSLYSSLLKAYCEANRPREVESVLRDARKAGIQLDSSCYEAMIQCKVLQKDTQGALYIFKEMKEAKISKSVHQEFDMLVQSCAESKEAGLMAKLLEEIKEGQRVDCGVHDWNSVIHFFCRKRLMHDAEKALKKMRALGHVPNAQTFHSMVTGYAAIGGKYLEVTELWGEMKVLAVSSSMKFDQELLDSLLYTFVRGGFFLRANEVVEMMEEGKMFVDKYKYRNLFLKYHKTAYKKKAPKIQTEAQCKRREAALAFKKWVGLV